MSGSNAKDNLSLGIVVCVRLNSSRLPAKAFLKLGKSTVLGELLKTLKRRNTYPVVIATSFAECDDLICQDAATIEIPVFRGAEDDVYSRLLECGLSRNFDVIIRLTGDNPFIKWDYLDFLISNFNRSCEPLDKVFTTRPNAPKGFNVDFLPISLLKRSLSKITSKRDREHVISYFLDRELFETFPSYPPHEKKLGWSWSIDTFDDYIRLKRYFDYEK